MSTDLEKDLRDALSDQAAKLPDDVSDGVLARDFRPRGSSGRPALAGTALTLAVGVVFAVSVVGSEATRRVRSPDGRPHRPPRPVRRSR